MVKEIRKKGFLKKLTEHISDFKLFFILGLFTLFIGVTFYLTQKPQEIRQRAFGTGMEFGFAADLSLNGSLQLTQFKSSVDQLVGNNQQWVRLAIIPSDIAGQSPPPTATPLPNTTVTPSISPTATPPNVVLGTSTAPVQWNTANLSIYDEAINYAFQKGLKLFVTTKTPDFANSYALSDYQSVTAEYFQFLSSRYSGKITVWNIFNNSNIRKYTDSSPLATLDSSYLSDFNAILTTARNAIKTADAGTFVTASAGGNPLTDTLVNNWNQFYDAINSNTDVISVEMYPNTDVAQISKLSAIIENLKGRYGKEVVVAATGLCTQNGIYSETDQQTYVPQAINNIRLSSAKLLLQYELVDQNSSSNTCDTSYGIVKSDGTPKSSYTAVITALDPIPTPTPTSVPASTPTPTVPSTPTPAPTNQGILNVVVLPTINATIRILSEKSGKVVLSATGGINKASLAPGYYYVAFSYPKTGGLRTPRTTLFKIVKQKTTNILGNFNTGKTTVNYQ